MCHRAGRGTSLWIMMMRIMSFHCVAVRVVTFCLGFALCDPVSAQGADDDKDLLALGAGWFDLFKRDDQAADFRLEYRSRHELWFLKPWAGIEATGDGAFYGVAGLLADVHLTDRIILTPSAGVGAYENGDGKDMGNVLQFRTQGELAYEFESGARVALAVSHISNARTSNGNPGAEILTLYVMMPIRGFF